MENYIDRVYGKLFKFVGIFNKLRNKLPSAVLQTIYYAFVLHIFCMVLNFMPIHISLI
jgi:hypothetical protein